MSWNEVAPGKYRRPLDNLERLLRNVAGIFSGFNREHWAVNIVARLKFPQLSEDDIVAALRQAWIQTRYHYPLIAATLNGQHHVYKIPSQQLLENWVSDSFFVEEGKTVDEFLSAATLSTYSSFHFFPASSEILMRTHHWQIDGIGAMHLLDRFLELFSVAPPLPTWGDEWRRLPPSHAEAAPLPSEKSPEVEDAAQRLYAQNPFNVPSIGLDMSPNAPGGTQRSMLTFTPSALDALVAACKEASLGITAAIHAAVVVATQEMAASSTKGRDFVSQAFFNHRPYLQAPYSDPTKWPMGSWMVSLPFSLPENDFLAQARALQKIYKQPMSVGDSPVLQYYDAYVGMAADMLEQPPPPGTPMPMPTQPQLSSIGLVDGRIRHTYDGKHPIVVEHVEPLLDMMTTPFLMFQWSWRGRLMINVCCNENHYEKAYVDRFLERVRAILAEGMGIDMQLDG